MAPSASHPINYHRSESLHPYASSFPSISPIAQVSIQRDLDAAYDDPFYNTSDADDEGESDTATLRPSTSAPGAGGYFMAGSYRRPSFALPPGRGAVLTNFRDLDRKPRLTVAERDEGIAEERSLLRDCNVIPPKHPRMGEQSESLIHKLHKITSIPGGDLRVMSPSVRADDNLPPEAPGETTALLGDPELPYGGHDSPTTISKKWEEALAAGIIHTTWQREAKTLSKYSAPLIVTFVLQYSLTVASIFTVGHLGPVYLGATSLASMTANISGFAIYQGLATSLDTLCAQAYGSGRPTLVGLQTQRMIIFLLSITIPIGAVWIASPWILRCMVPNPETARLAGQYLRILLFGAPGYLCFESGKRYVQAQGLFSACLYVLLFCAPFNAVMNWLLVWHFKIGFIGAPIAVAITDNLLPLCLLLYIRVTNSTKCWAGWSRRSLQNWGPMIRLALPGVLMVEAEVLAFEILTLVAAYFGTDALAAQSVLSTLTSLTFQLPFPLSIASSTRIANLIGATLPGAAKVTARVALIISVFIGILNSSILFIFRDQIPLLFTSDPGVANIVRSLLPLCASFQLFDALAANTNGILRGLGQQSVGGWVQLGCYYVYGVPVSLLLGLVGGWGLWGLWFGVATALGLIFLMEFIFLSRTSWDKSVEEARKRNAMF
ncbi:MAG: hypothetical protein M1834_001577 [Cirrosporium novae-zelandiae]|nr:MAG: hypothetical protein M1834_004094 [Cirrosporium novae-zelandiae]KAI9735562.1 MAG: hypothetical protein M1834_001577 [Cirrosporium novae-zelandiae]